MTANEELTLIIFACVYVVVFIAGFIYTFSDWLGDIETKRPLYPFLDWNNNFLRTLWIFIL